MALAQEAFERHRPWGASGAGQVVWDVRRFTWKKSAFGNWCYGPAGRRAFPMPQWMIPFLRISDRLQGSRSIAEMQEVRKVAGLGMLDELGAEARDQMTEVACPSGWAMDADDEWRRAVDQDLCVTPESGGRGFGPSEDLVGRPFRDLQNPHEPVLGIWELGYAVDEIRDGMVFLVAQEA